MEVLNKVLYWISTGLMLPVVVILIFLFLKALVALGSFYAFYITRLKSTKSFDEFLEKVEENGLSSAKLPLVKSDVLAYLERLVNATQSLVSREKILVDFEMAMTKKLATTKSMSKLGPVLGLMGTLIPMGPALVGLGSGNIASMAENMQVAFSTTVVGLVVGAIGYILTEVKQRWFAKDLSQLHYVADLITESQSELIRKA